MDTFWLSSKLEIKIMNTWWCKKGEQESMQFEINRYLWNIVRLAERNCQTRYSKSLALILSDIGICNMNPSLSFTSIFYVNPWSPNSLQKRQPTHFFSLCFHITLTGFSSHIDKLSSWNHNEEKGTASQQIILIYKLNRKLMLWEHKKCLTI